MTSEAGRKLVANVHHRIEKSFPWHSQVCDGETHVIGERLLTSHTMPHFVPDPDDTALNQEG